MTREHELELTLAHVIKWLSGDGGFDALKPVSAQTANRICAICDIVLYDKKTLKEAVEETL